MIGLEKIKILKSINREFLFNLLLTHQTRVYVIQIGNEFYCQDVSNQQGIVLLYNCADTTLERRFSMSSFLKEFCKISIHYDWVYVNKPVEKGRKPGRIYNIGLAIKVRIVYDKFLLNKLI